MWNPFRQKPECIACEDREYNEREIGGVVVKVPCGYCSYRRFKERKKRD